MKKEILYKLLARILAIIPTKNKLVALESNSDLSDSSLEIYNKLPDDYNAIWFVDDPKKYKKEKKVKYYYKKATYKNIPQYIISVFMMSRARYCFYTHNFIGNIYKKKQKRVFLTHAALPLKNSAGHFWDYRWNTFIVSTSAFAAHQRCKTFSGGEDRIIVTGLPRNDRLFYKAKSQYNDRIIDRKAKKTIVWMPTFKTHKDGKRTDYSTKTSNDISLLDERNLKRLDKKLHDSQITLIIKPHPAQDLAKLKIQETKNIKLITNEDLKKEKMEVYDLLRISDALITDYSSIYIDYLLLDRPIAFDLCDLKSYSKGIGFNSSNPRSLMPGTQIESFDNLIQFVQDINDGKDSFCDERRKLTKACHKYIDSHSTERLLKILQISK